MTLDRTWVNIKETENPCDVNQTLPSPVPPAPERWKPPTFTEARTAWVTCLQCPQSVQNVNAWKQT